MLIEEWVIKRIRRILRHSTVCFQVDNGLLNIRRGDNFTAYISMCEIWLRNIVSIKLFFMTCGDSFQSTPMISLGYLHFRCDHFFTNDFEQGYCTLSSVLFLFSHYYIPPVQMRFRKLLAGYNFISKTSKKWIVIPVRMPSHGWHFAWSVTIRMEPCVSRSLYDFPGRAEATVTFSISG